MSVSGLELHATLSMTMSARFHNLLLNSVAPKGQPNLHFSFLSLLEKNTKIGNGDVQFSMFINVYYVTVSYVMQQLHVVCRVLLKL